MKTYFGRVSGGLSLLAVGYLGEILLSAASFIATALMFVFYYASVSAPMSTGELLKQIARVILPSAEFPWLLNFLISVPGLAIFLVLGAIYAVKYRLTKGMLISAAVTMVLYLLLFLYLYASNCGDVRNYLIMDYGEFYPNPILEIAFGLIFLVLAAAIIVLTIRSLKSFLYVGAK